MKKIFCIITILILSIISCQKNNTTDPTVSGDGLTYPDSSMYSRDFRILTINSDGNEDFSTAAKFYRVAEYDKLDIYVEENLGYKKENIDYIANEFNKYYDEEVRIYGTHTDVDNNNKIIIVLYELDDSLNGFFHPWDLQQDKLNNGEILYLNLKKVNEDPDYMSGTILHELQHLINYNVHFGKKEMSAWLNEALSESTSVLFNEATAKSRIDEFNSYTKGYYCFYTWNLPFILNVFANYPSASVFMNWLYQKNGGNSDVFKNIAANSSDEDYQKVLSSVSYIGASSWDNLLLNWLEGIDNGEVAGAKLVIQNAGSRTLLYPGAAVVYSGKSYAADPNLVTRDIGEGIEITLNKNTDLNGAYTLFIVPQSSLSVQASKKYKTADDKISIPKYKHILFDKDGNIKKY